jgi:class 3 adenylate cyclase/predicted ATPase
VGFTFGEYFLDVDRRELRCGRALVRLAPQVFDLLLYLLRNRDRVVTKDDLLEAVWGGRIVSESALTTRINAARKAIGDSGEEQKLIRTLPRRGFRFIGRVGEGDRVFEAQQQTTVGVSGAVDRAIESAGLDQSEELSERRQASDARLPIAISAERRQLTVMSCNLAGAAALASRLDPEDLRDLFAAYWHALAETAGRFEGFVAKHSGGGISIYFGYPRAHEDDAERAIRCGLAVAETFLRHRPGAELPTRVGIATGMVIVDEPTDSEFSEELRVVGEAPSLAARLQELAAPNSLLIADSTRRLVGELFEYSAVAAEGIAAPAPAWRVLRPSAVESRFEALRGTVLSPLVGRDEEIDLLSRRWGRAKAGDGQVVLVCGEPGIGKSRLAAALQDRLRTEPHVRLRCFCSPYHRDSALFPFIDQLERAAGIAREDQPTVKQEKLEGLLAPAAPPEEDVALLADLLSLPASERRPLPNFTPQRKKERTLAALIRQLEGLARRQPVLMVFEDAHWIDPTSRELLDLAVERVRSLPVLLIVTFRPEFQPPWPGQPQVTMLVLNRLDRHERTVLIGRIAGGKALPDQLVAQIVDRTDGVPLFVEELTKSILESGLLREEADRYVLDGESLALSIPTSLHDLLMARLDRLASVRRAAQIGAAIGREFPYTLLSALSHSSEDELQAALGKLVASGLVFQRGTPPDAVYAFKHALVQDAAHESLLRRTRRQLHARIAELLEAEFPETTDIQPELLARHYAEAGLVEKSVAYWGKAGRRSAARSAMAEAAAQLQKGLGQLALLPDTPERRRQELEFYGTLGAVLLALKGQAAPETGQVFARAQELWEELGSPSEYLQVPYGQCRYLAVRGELDLARRLDENLLDLSRQRSHSAGLVLGHMSSGRTMMYTGRFASSRSHLEEMLTLYDPTLHGSLVDQIGNYPGVIAQASLAIGLLCLGFPEQSLARSNAATAEARRRSHPMSLAVSLSDCALLLSLAADNTALEERADELIAVATEHDFPLWSAQGTIYRGWAKVKNGDLAKGMQVLRCGVNAYCLTGARAWTPYYTALLARAGEFSSEIGEGLALLDKALQIADRTGERWFAAELHRYRGQLLLRQGDFEAAEQLYRKALSIAHHQEAKLWELRAAASLARLRRDQGRRAEARDLLAPVYGWFTEGFDTADLKEAKVLLGEVS